MTQDDRDLLRRYIAEADAEDPADTEYADLRRIVVELLDAADAHEAAAVTMTGHAVYAAVSGGTLEPVDICQADVRADPAEAEILARDAWQSTGKSFRVMKITEHAVYVGPKG